MNAYQSRIDGPTPKTHSQNPILGGATVVGLVFDDGVVIAADNLSSYGSMARFRDIQRVRRVNANTIVGAGGDLADFQHLWKSIEQKQIDDESRMDGEISGPLSLHSWLSRVHYNKRCDFDPYHIEWVIGGIQDDKPFLGYVNKLGTSFQDKAIATGRLHGIALPLLRDEVEKSTKITEQKAIEIVTKAIENLFYRDCYASPIFYLGVITKDKGSRVDGPIYAKQNWEFAKLSQHFE